MNTVAEKIMADPGFEACKPVWVSVYRHSRCYGGPEEGGWWYDRYYLEGSVRFADETLAQNYLMKIRAEVEQQNIDEQPDRNRAMAMLPDEDCDTAYHPEGFIPNGWSDGGDLQVVVEEQRGSWDNSHEPKPHYE